MRDSRVNRIQQKGFNLEFFDRTIDSQQLKNIVNQNRQNGRYSQTINNAFDVIGLIDKYQKTKDVKTAQIIKQSFDNKLMKVIKEGGQDNNSIQILNPTKIFMMRKVGNVTSKEVERQCKFTKNGIIQLKDNKTLNIKQVVKLQEKDKGKMSDIAWIKDQKFKFRVVMKDTKNLLRAVFTQTFQQSKQIIDYCIIFLPKFLSIQKATQSFSNVFKKSVVKSIAQKISQSYLSLSNSGMRQSIRTQKQQVKQQVVTIRQQQNIVIKNNKKRQQGINNLLFQNNDKQILNKFIFNWLDISTSKNVQKNDFNFPPPKRVVPITPTRQKQQPMDFVQNFTLIFEKVELLKQNDIIRKPILDVKMTKGSYQIFKQTYETVLQKKDPHLIYLLHCDEHQMRELNFEDQLSKIQIQVTIRDRLINQASVALLRLRVRQRVNQLLYLASQDGSIRLQVRYITDDTIRDQIKQKMVNQDGIVLICQDLQQADIIKIKQKYWNPDNKNEYYTGDISLSITQILGRFEVVPKFWWFGISQQQYQILSFLQAASQSLSFILIESHLHIVRSLMKIFHNSDKMIQRVFTNTLSIIIYYLKPYYSKSYFNKVQNIHALIGIDVNCDLPFKISLQINTLMQILKLQVPKLMQRFRHKNVHLGLIIFEYLYEIYSRNFNIRLLTSLWNYLFKFKEYIQQNLLLLGIILIKINQESLLKVYRYPEIVLVLTQKNKAFTNLNQILLQLEELRKKYFIKPDNVIDTIKSKLLYQNPFDRVVNSFLRKQNNKLELNSKNKVIEKKKIIQRLIEQKHQFVIPKYPPKNQNLHIYFHKMPNIDGSYMLSLKIKSVYYQCYKIKEDTYYIMKKINSPVQIVITYQGKRWSNTAEFIQGIHYSSLNLFEDGSTKNIMRIEYTGGFLTQSQEIAIIKGKPTEHYLGSYMKLDNIIGQCSRQISQCFFLQNLPQRRKIPYDITQNIKVIFTSGSNRFNDVDFYLSWILELKISPLQKIEKLKLYSQSLWTQLFHSPSCQLYKILFRQYLDKMNFPIQDGQFEFLYNANFTQFDCPRLISAKFQNHNGKKARLDQYLQKFLSEKSSKFLYSDLIASQKHLFNLIHKALIEQKFNQFDGILILKYSSYGQVKKRVIPLRYSKNQLHVDTQNQQYYTNHYQLKDVTPELIGSQSYPSFSKITRKHFNQDSDISHIKKKYQDNQKNNFQQQKTFKTMNVLGCLDEKLKYVIPLRYRNEEYTTNIPFFNYFSELLYKIIYPVLPKLYLNNVQVPPSKICTFNGELDLSDNQRGQDIRANKRLGLHGNISKWNFQTPIVYFWSQKYDDFFKTLYPIFVNYGQGVFRTQNCKVDGYCRGMKNQQRIFFIVELHGKKTLIPRQQLLVQNINLFTKVDLQSQRYQGFKKIMKQYQGKTLDQKVSETAESMKFTNLMKKQGGFYEVKNLQIYTKTFDEI